MASYHIHFVETWGIGRNIYWYPYYTAMCDICLKSTTTAFVTGAFKPCAIYYWETESGNMIQSFML